MYKLFLDIETSGLDPNKHAPLEVGLIIESSLDGEQTVEHEVSELIDWPDLDVIFMVASPQALAVNHLTPELIRERGISSKRLKLRLLDLFQKLKITSKNAVWVAQNPQFDLGFLNDIISPDERIAADWPYRCIDGATMGFMHELFMSQNETLPLSKDKLAQKLNLQPEEMPHRALNGAKHLRVIYNTIISQITIKK